MKDPAGAFSQFVERARRWRKRPHRSAADDWTTGHHKRRPPPGSQPTIAAQDHLSEAVGARGKDDATMCGCPTELLCARAVHGLQRVPHTAKMAWIQQVAGAIFALYPEPTSKQQRSATTEIRVALVPGRPIRGREEVQAFHAGRVNDMDGVAAVPRTARRPPITGDHEGPTAAVDGHARGLPHPRFSLGARLITAQGLAGGGHRHKPAVVVTAIAGVAAEGDKNAPLGQSERPSLILDSGVLPTRVDRDVDARRAGPDIEPPEAVLHATLNAGGRDGKDPAGGSVVNRRTGDAKWVNVSARETRRPNGRRQMTRPDRAPILAVDGIQRVIFCGCDNETADDQRARLHRSVKRGFPHHTGRTQRWAVGIKTGMRRVTVITSPVISAGSKARSGSGLGNQRRADRAGR